MTVMYYAAQHDRQHASERRLRHSIAENVGVYTFRDSTDELDQTRSIIKSQGTWSILAVAGSVYTLQHLTSSAASIPGNHKRQQESQLPLTDPHDTGAQRMLNIPYRIVWYSNHFSYSA